jgi:hypothetical protein
MRSFIDNFSPLLAEVHTFLVRGGHWGRDTLRHGLLPNRCSSTCMSHG